MIGATLYPGSQALLLNGGTPTLTMVGPNVIYEMDLDIQDDAGELIRWERTCPHMSSEAKRLFYSKLQLDMEVGMGNTVDPGADPQVALQWSDDGGKTWSNEHWASAGTVGSYLQRLVWRQLGSGRDRVFRVFGDAPTKVCLVNAYIDVNEGGH